jgi:PhzF family phenazine biosynthesis protein
VRIFTLSGELPFAGHPTLGTCHVWRQTAGHTGDGAVQECGAGLVRLRIEGQRIAFEAPPLIRDGPVDESILEEIAAVLGVGRSDIRASKWVDNGPGWVGVLLDGSDAVLDLSPEFSRATRPGDLNIGVVGLHREGRECLYEVRAFFAGTRGEMIEDPVTGSLNASVAQWLIGAGLAEAPYVAAQGTALGRKGRVHISSVDGSIWVGGRVFEVADGHMAV